MCRSSGSARIRSSRPLLAGVVDGASILEPILTIVQERKPTTNPRIVAPANAMLPRQPGAVVAVREATITADRASVAKLVELHVRATSFAKSRPRRRLPNTSPPSSAKGWSIPL